MPEMGDCMSAAVPVRVETSAPQPDVQSITTPRPMEVGEFPGANIVAGDRDERWDIPTQTQSASTIRSPMMASTMSHLMPYTVARVVVMVTAAMRRHSSICAGQKSKKSQRGYNTPHPVKRPLGRRLLSQRHQMTSQ